MRRARPVVGAVALTTLALVVTAVRVLAVEVQITTLRAAERGHSDAQLVSLRPRLRRLVGYRSFQIVQDERRRCAWQSEEAFMIPGGRLLHVVPKGMRDQTVAMQVRFLDGPRALVNADVRLQNRGVMFFGVGQEAGATDGALIIMLRAEE